MNINSLYNIMAMAEIKTIKKTLSVLQHTSRACIFDTSAKQTQGE